jgi:hypothetical protein
MLKQLLIVAAAIGLSTASPSAAQWHVKQIPPRRGQVRHRHRPGVREEAGQGTVCTDWRS